MAGSVPLLKPDGRQSETALSIQRGVARMLRDHNYAMLTEFTLASGRRADVIGLSPEGQIWIIEIKSSPEDYRADGKWHEYREYCDRFSFAVPPTMDYVIIPEEAGLIVTDQWGAEILRAASEHPMHASRRKAVTHNFARTAALRLQAVWEGRFVL
ncbi:MmcB family DNA repair protein [Aestuariivirga litoralis]|uniref:MmcB family DNA repair protein n=1 Tax=Aestuariivirga litoralis TaxID=2650924 RepID=UPI0018C7BA0F|nr:MmcB family DNA repair protein [Aestuariivirga litoralis]MBG1233828.1 MmcB family DNA repair protein [Aestuariivirga litoralis]